MPAEWQAHAATWMVWPHNAETWPGCLEAAERAFHTMVEAIATGEAVRVLVLDGAVARRLRAAGLPAELHEVRTNDSWMRDIGPTFVEENGRLIAIDWTFNAWGGKHPPWDLDDAVAGRVASLEGVPALRVDLVVEGGALEVDGEGTLLATESTLLDPKRNPGVERTEMERRLGELLGVTKVVWLGATIEGDDTDGHVDGVARFVAPGRVVCAYETDRSSPNYEALRDCRERLRSARDARGQRLEVIDLPMPPRLEADGEPLPASYANFYVANRAVLVPSFGVDTDEKALATLAPLFPGRRLTPVPSRALVRGLGACHCLTQQQPQLQPADAAALSERRS